MTRVRVARGSGRGFGVDDISCAACVHLGFFARESLAVEWVDARGGVAAMSAVLEGRAEVAYAGFGPVLKLRAEGQPCRIFVSQARALAQALVVRKGIPDPQALDGCAWAVDAIGALSHHMARLTVRALGIPEERIRWQAVGPPPERIAALLTGKADASLVRTEEALVLDRDQPDRVRRLLDFDDLKRLARAMVGASRALHAQFDAFRACVRAYVDLPLADAELRLLWQREHDGRGWAVDGELNPAPRPLRYEEIIAPRFITA